jgi:hypothetical protein
MLINTNGIGTVKSFPRPAQLKMYGLRVSPGLASKVAALAEAAGMSSEDFIVAAVKACIGGNEETWHAEAQNGSNS